MNAKNTIKSLIPRRLFELVPSSIRNKWADRIADKVQAQNPALYAAIGEWNSISEEDQAVVLKETIKAAEEVLNETPAADDTDR